MDMKSDEDKFWLRVGLLSFELEHHLQCKGMYFKSSFIDNIALRIVSNMLKPDTCWFEKRLIGVRVATWKLKCKVSWYRMRIGWKLTSLKEVI